MKSTDLLVVTEKTLVTWTLVKRLQGQLRKRLDKYVVEGVAKCCVIQQISILIISMENLLALVPAVCRVLRGGSGGGGNVAWTHPILKTAIGSSPMQAASPMLSSECCESLPWLLCRLQPANTDQLSTVNELQLSSVLLKAEQADDIDTLGVEEMCGI